MESTHATARPLPFELLGPRRVVGEFYNRKFQGEVKVAPRGFDGKFCFACQSYLTRKESDAFANEDRPCFKCSQAVHWVELSVDLREDQLPLANDREVLSRRWFHVSQHANWDARVKESKAFVHIGSREAAMARLDHLHLLDEESVVKAHYLHAVLLCLSVKLVPGIYHDQINRWPKTRAQSSGETFVDMAGFDALRYMNEYEGAGTVSLLADPAAFTLVESAKISSS